MNRRSFLSSLFKGTVTAAVAPQIVTHGLKLVQRRSGIVEARVNPKWVTANYCVKFLVDQSGMDSISVGPPPVFPPNMGEVLHSFSSVNTDALRRYRKILLKDYQKPFNT